MGRISPSGKRKGAEAVLRVGWVFSFFVLSLERFVSGYWLSGRNQERERLEWGGGSGRWDREVEVFGL